MSSDEDARLLAEWEAGPGRRPTPEEGKRWLEQAHRFPRVCSECRHEISQHSSEGGVGCLHVGPIRGWHDDEPCARWACWCVEACPCLRPGTSQADQ